MLADSVSKTLTQIASQPFRAVLWKSIGATIALFISFWFLLDATMEAFLFPLIEGWTWLTTALGWILGTGLVIGMGFLIAPVTSVFAGLFLDQIAETVEQKYYPDDPPGKALTLSQSMGITARFLGLILLANLVALALVLFLGLGVFIFFVLNGYLLGREYFQFAALRHHSLKEVEELRQQNAMTIFLGGMIIAALLSIPLLNLLTPLFAAALMVHIYKGLDRKT